MTKVDTTSPCKSSSAKLTNPCKNIPQLSKSAEPKPNLKNPLK